ncbi:MAG: ParB N-terminal domain-containing protein, partial [Prochloraceae cyanobacterium]
MLERTKVKVIGGAACRRGKIGVVITSLGTGKNIGKVEIYIDRLGNFWYDPKDLEIIEKPSPKIAKEKFTVGFYDVDPKQLKPHPANPKIYGENEDISDLLLLISVSGLEERLVVNTKGEIVSGNRRKRAALKLELPTVPIEVRAFESIEKEIEFLLNKNASRTKTVYQKVREGQQWQAVEGKLAKDRMKTAQKDRSGRKNFSYAAEKGKTSDIIGGRVGLGSGVTYTKAVKVVEEIDHLFTNGQTEIAEAYKKILNRPSVDGAYKLLSQSRSYRENILELFAENQSLSMKDAKKLLKDLNPPPMPISEDTSAQIAVGMKVELDAASPIAPGAKGEIVSLPNAKSAIVLLDDNSREMVDRSYIKPALENLPQSLIDRTIEQPRSKTPEVPKRKKPKTSKPPQQQSQSISQELDRKQQELGLGRNKESILPEIDRLDEHQHQNPTDIDDRPFANAVVFTDEDSEKLTTLVTNIKKTVKFLRKEDYRSIGDA